MVPVFGAAMNERRKLQRSRSLKGGKILFNNKQSVITCTVRNLSTEGANLQVQTAVGVPAFFDLLLEGDNTTRPCDVIWKAQNRIGVSFRGSPSQPSPAVDLPQMLPAAATATTATTSLRSDIISLRTALDEVPLGIVLLDTDLRAQFINRAFRAMWHLPDATADGRPAFVTLLYHGRDTHAYAVPDDALDNYIQDRVAHVRKGSANHIDLRLASGDIIRFQCTTLPAGGRMLSYTDVTDLVHRADEMESLRAALDNMEQGIILLDRNLDVEFMNAAVRRQWQLPDSQTGGKLAFADLVGHARESKTFDMPGEELEIYIAQRIARVRAGDPRPMDMRHQDGRIIRSQCSILPNGGRMLSYVDVTDLVRRADEVRRFSAG
jgi:PAS domain-containing protein